MEIIEGKMPFMGYETYYRIVGRRSERHHSYCYMVVPAQVIIILRFWTN